MRPGQCDEATAFAILDKYVEVGGNFIDTADVYSQGEAETIVGKSVPARAVELFTQSHYDRQVVEARWSRVEGQDDNSH